MKRNCLIGLVAGLAATQALADPLTDALGTGGGIVCFTRAYDDAWLNAHRGQTLSEAKFSIAYSDEAPPWPVLRMSLKSGRETLYLFGACSWVEGTINRGVQNNILIDSFKPESGVGCHLVTDVTGASAEEGGDFPVDWQDDGKRIEVHFDEYLAVWRSFDTSRNADFVETNPADRIIRLDRADPADCADLAKFAEGQTR